MGHCARGGRRGTAYDEGTDDVERPSLTNSVDASFAFFVGSRRASGELVQDVLLALGVIAETLDASQRGSELDRNGNRVDCRAAQVPASEVVDRLLDVRAAAADVSARRVRTARYAVGTACHTSRSPGGSTALTSSASSGTS